LYLPNNAQQVLILFPGGGTVAKDIAANFAIVEPAPQQNIALFLMNFNRHLWLTPNQCEQLTNLITTALQAQQLEDLPVVLGGMSIGGNVATTLGSYWLQQEKKPPLKGVFIVDAPLDLYALYENALFDTQRPELDEQRLAEPNWIVNYFTAAFGTDSTTLLHNIQQLAPLTYAQQHWENIAPLQGIPTRFYTEPDPAWWQANRQTAHERTNAHKLQQWTALLKQQNWQKLELIETQNKGYRANGERHPHSWSIVEVEELLQWMKKIR
jgi:pimeloyl-ACP methyl ester carboxylesterase